MRIAVTGSIATDHLMTFPGRFTEYFVEGRLDQVSLSFLADGLDIRFGGVAANITYGLARLGLRPLLVGAAGTDFDEQRAWLEGAGVDTSAVLVSSTRHTARFVCTTDRDQNQIATFYPGAMAEARGLHLAHLAERPDFVLVGPDDPAAMVQHAITCRREGLTFAADPSQQLAGMSRSQILTMISGADFLFTNAYERDLLLQRTGLCEGDVLAQVGTWVTTHGAQGVRLNRRSEPTVHIEAVQVGAAADPTGAGDAFRAGFLRGLANGRDPAAAARLGCVVAAYALESSGSQTYRLSLREAEERAAAAYGEPVLAAAT